MKAPAGQTFGDSVTSEAAAKKFRNGATGIGQTRAASIETGAVRSQAVANAMPPSQAAVAPRDLPSSNGGSCQIPIQRPGYVPPAGISSAARLLRGQ